MSVQIIADSTCDLSPELVQKYQITILPLYVSMGEMNGRDGLEITPADIFKQVYAGGALPKTAAATVQDFTDQYTKILEQNPEDEIVCMTISSHFSSCYQNACIAAEAFPDKVQVVDSLNLSTGFGHSVLAAAELAQAGKNASEIAEILREDIVPNVDASFIVNRLDFLYKGGRCSGVAALGANLLKLKPCIAVVNGEMKVIKKYRGNFTACVEQYAADRLADMENVRMHRIFVTHTCEKSEPVEAAKKIVSQKGAFDFLEETTAGCTVSSHCGPNTLGVLFIRKETN